MRKFKLLIIAITGYSAILSFLIPTPYEKNSNNKQDLVAQIELVAEESLPHPETELIIEQTLNHIFVKNTITAINEFSKNKNIINDVDINLGIDVPIIEEKIPLIYDCHSIDYMSYVPEMVFNRELETSLNIINPEIKLVASSAILFDANTGEILFYKNPVKPVFPSSTSKLLSALVALEWCTGDEVVTVGDEIRMIASDSSKAKLKRGQVLTTSTVLEGMLLPSGNDAAYVMATYVGRKSLKNPEATKEKAVKEFVRLMNLKASELGAINSCFITPDGYDAIGQYTTAYDIGLIGLAAVKNDTILRITQLSRVNKKIISGETIAWNNTNALIRKDSSWYYSYAIGLKTGTTTMAGRCLISAAKKDNRVVVSVIMNSTSEGRWRDSIKLLKFGLDNN